jgi:hypothetical protein
MRQSPLLSGKENARILSNFKNWLMGPDGGRKENKVASQCKQQVQLVAEFINPESPSRNSLMSRNVLRDDWLTNFDKHLINFIFMFKANVATFCPP